VSVAAPMTFVGHEARRGPCSSPRCGNRPLWEVKVAMRNGRYRYPAYCTQCAIRTARRRNIDVGSCSRCSQFTGPQTTGECQHCGGEVVKLSV